MTVPSDQTHRLRSLGSAPVQWARSVVTSLLLAVGAVAPAASIAAEPDRSQEGGAPPEHARDVETDNPSFDPGGETELPFDTGPPPSAQSPPSPDEAPVESEPLDDPEGRAAPFAEPETPEPGTPEDAPASPIEEPPPAAPAPESTTEPPASVPMPESPPAPQPPAQQLPPEPGSQAAAHRQRTWTVVVPAGRAPSEGAPAPSQVDSPDSPTTTNVSAATGRTNSEPAASRPAGDARFHTVRPGESLWTIAEDLLGPEASATRIAAEVARLWELNRDRIPSGDPDLIAVGQQLRLR